MTATTSTTTGDVDASLVYGSTTEPKKLTKPADSFARAISINEFMQDVHLRFQKDYDNALQLSVYFFTDKSTYTTKVENDYGTRHFQYIRPEMITFTSLDAKTKKPVHVVRTQDLDVYADYGIKFETHLVWNGKKYRPATDEDDSSKFRAKCEIRSDRKVNYLVINTKQQTFVKKAGKFDLCDEEIKYYDWKVMYPVDTRNDVKWMLENIYPNAEEWDVASLIDSANASDEDINMVFDA